MMTKQSIKLFDLWSETVDALAREGLLLCSVGSDGKPNVMTIGWLTGGVINSAWVDGQKVAFPARYATRNHHRIRL